MSGFIYSVALFGAVVMQTGWIGLICGIGFLGQALRRSP